MLRQNHRWTTTLSVAVALSLAVWVSASAVGQRMVERDADRASEGIRMLEFQRLYDKGEVLVVDVRDQASYDQGRIAGAVHLGLNDVPARAEEIRRLAASRVVVTYCSCPSEASSLRAAQDLREQGVPARALIGGYHGWVAAGGRTYTLPHVPTVPPR